MKVKRRVWFILLGCALVGVGVALFWPRGPKEPEYQGRKLSELIALANPFAGRGLLGPQTSEASYAIIHIGSNSLPLLVRWVTRDVPKWELSMAGAIENNAKLARLRGVGRALLYRDVIRAFDSESALGLLGSAAKPAVPELGRRLESARNMVTQDRIVSALHWLSETGGDIGPAMPGILLAEMRLRKRTRVGKTYLNNFANGPHFMEALGNCLKNSDRAIRKEAVGQLYLMYAGTGNDPVLLRTALTDTDAEVRESAARCLSRLKRPLENTYK